MVRRKVEVRYLFIRTDCFSKEEKVVKESVERIQYISDYIVGYKTKIESLNRKGLFDTATLYEIFAQKICEIWFGQKFLKRA